jgi:hypothetical protein
LFFSLIGIEADECERFFGIHDAEFVRFPREFLPVRVIIVGEFAAAAETLRGLRTRRVDFWSPIGEWSDDLRLFDSDGIFAAFLGDVVMELTLLLIDTTGALKEKNLN